MTSHRVQVFRDYCLTVFVVGHVTNMPLCSWNGVSS